MGSGHGPCGGSRGCGDGAGDTKMAAIVARRLIALNGGVDFWLGRARAVCLTEGRTGAHQQPSAIEKRFLRWALCHGGEYARPESGGDGPRGGRDKLLDSPGWV